MAAQERRKRPRGSVDQLASGALRVRVFAGRDPVTGRDHYLSRTIPAGKAAAREAERVRVELLSQVDEGRSPRTTATVSQLLDRWLDVVEVERTTRAGYVGKIEKHIRPTLGNVKVGRLDAEMIDSLYSLLRRCREHCGGRPYVEHRVRGEHDCDQRCRPHECVPLSAGSIRVIHSILGGALKRAVRWGWIAVNPISQAAPPSVPKPDPQPPTVEEAARIVNESWKEPDWGALVWLAMVTGARRGEISGLRWAHVDLDAGVVTLYRSIAQLAGEMWEKDTKTHQRRRVALDPETVDVLREHRARCDARAESVGVAVSPKGFVFSLAPDCSEQRNPGGITQRYGRLARRLGIDTHFHALRHYSATELISAGVDPRTVAGRLGHAGGGATTLRVYSAWVAEADQRASLSLGARMPARPRAPKPAAE